MLKQLQKRHQEEKGFTLIELMVVVLIMGILMAIAIPTFLSTRGSANDASAKSNLTNAFTNEKSYYASNQVFYAATDPDTGNTLDDTLPWGTGLGQVAAYVSGTTAPNSEVLIVAGSNSGDCFYVVDNETANSAIIGYAETTGASSSSPCAAPSGAPAAINSTTTGSAAGHTTANSAGVPSTFYSTM